MNRLTATLICLGVIAIAGTASAQQGLVAEYSFEEASGNTILDTSGSNLNGQLIGASRVAGVEGNALNFVEPDFAGIPGATGVPQSLASLSTGTISVWFRLESIPQTSALQPIVYLGNNQISPQDRAIVIELGHGVPGGSVLYFTYYFNGSTPLCFDSVVDLNVQQWYHFVVVVGQNFNTAYLDGVEMVNRDYNAGTANDRAFFADVPDPSVLWLGTGYAKELPELRYLNGQIDEFRIFDRPLTEAEVQGLYNVAGPAQFIRGDVNNDGRLDIADPIRVIEWLFIDPTPLDCLGAADANDDGAVNVADPISALASLFNAGAPPAAPYPNCGADQTPDTLPCSPTQICP